MASNLEESSPLLPNQEPIGDGVKPVDGEESRKINTSSAPPPPPPQPAPQVATGYRWTANGLPFSVVGEPVGRTPWDTGIASCLGRRDEFFGSDVEVCLVGALAPCVLYGSNVERLESAPGTFTNHCMTYTALYLFGNLFFGWNCLAPWFSYRNRTALRRRFNLEGNFESFTRNHGCCGSVLEDDTQREQWETACDFGTHVFCHPCALCQEGREVRRRLPHPGLNAQPILLMIPPAGQAMGRDAAAA
ncbi:hypothetical protein Dimus_034611 [Dionaea muscipula]